MLLGLVNFLNKIELTYVNNHINKVSSMIHSEDKLIEIFCHVDDFLKKYESEIASKLLSDKRIKHRSISEPVMSLSERMTIEIYYHLVGFKNFKYFYTRYVSIHLQAYFPEQISYNRFVGLKPDMMIYLYCYLLAERLGRHTGVNYIDSAKLTVCHNLRINSHKVFKHIAQRGKTSCGWFFGLKIHLIINQFGEILSFIITTGNIADNNLELGLRLCKNICGKLFGDKGYISKKLQEALAPKIQLITRVKRNMKNKLIELEDKILLNARGVIESVIDVLKNICNIEHSRHRSPKNAIVNAYAALVAYSFIEHKPTVKNHIRNVRELIQINQISIVV